MLTLWNRLAQPHESDERGGSSSGSLKSEQLLLVETASEEADDKPQPTAANEQ